jgi:hypothetical protein
MRAIIDFALSGSRFKAIIPKEHCKLTIALQGKHRIISRHVNIFYIEPS